MSICIIPARSGSKRIKNKNIKKINKDPLIGIVIKTAKKAKIFKKIIVSTDSKKISNILKKYGAEVPFLRNKKLSSDQAPLYKVLQDVVKRIKTKEKFIFCLFPTAILTRANDLKRSLVLIKKKKADHLCVVKKIENNIVRAIVKEGKYLTYLQPKFQLKMSQDLPNLFLDAGCFYIFKRTTLLKINTHKPMPKKTIDYLIDHKRAIDINYPKDLILSKKIFNKLRLN